jgi:hypothetical protein
MKNLFIKTLLLLLIFTNAASAADPLPSWNDTAPKKAIIAFVEQVTREGTADFVPVAERIATFDNDGTLWSEKPTYFQLLTIFWQVMRVSIPLKRVLETHSYADR